MELYTRILLPKARFSFSYEDRVVMMGSCFAENIGRKLEENKFSVDINPFGTLYNPASVAEGLRMLLRPERFTPGDLFQHEGIYHSFTHHSRFSAPSEEECLGHINSRLSESSDFLRKATRLVITLGTAFVYRLKSDGRIVSNCHKLPEKIIHARDRRGLETSVTSPLGTKSRLENLIYRKSDPPLERRGAREPTQQSYPIASHGRLTERLSRPNRLLPRL